MAIKAIETRYKGHMFRSRLEARWAVFFDRMGVPWNYEMEGFTLPDGQRYLPDFWLPHGNDQRPFPAGNPPVAGYWLEIKPLPLNREEIGKLVDLANGTLHRAFAFAGDPWPGEFAVYQTSSAVSLYGDMVAHDSSDPDVPGYEIDDKVIENTSASDVRIDLPVLCPLCDGFGIGSMQQLNTTWKGLVFESIGEGACNACDGSGSCKDELFWVQTKLHGFFQNVTALWGDRAVLYDAFQAARSARFEHGQSGAAV